MPFEVNKGLGRRRIPSKGYLRRSKRGERGRQRAVPSNEPPIKVGKPQEPLELYSRGGLGPLHDGLNLAGIHPDAPGSHNVAQK